MPTEPANGSHRAPLAGSSGGAGAGVDSVRSHGGDGMLGLQYDSPSSAAGGAASAAQDDGRPAYGGLAARSLATAGAADTSGGGVGVRRRSQDKQLAASSAQAQAGPGPSSAASIAAAAAAAASSSGQVAAGDLAMSGKKRRNSSSPRPLTISDDNPLADGDADGAVETDAEKEKRTKTPRACDRCRGKKTRCDLVPGSEPMVCKFCVKNGLECTFFLPITETRWKKRRTGSSGAAEARPALAVPPADVASRSAAARIAPIVARTSMPPPQAAPAQAQQAPTAFAQAHPASMPHLPPPPSHTSLHAPPHAFHHAPPPTHRPSPYQGQYSTPSLGPSHPIFHHPPPPIHYAPKPSPSHSHHSPRSGGSTGQTTSSAADRTHDRLARIHGPTSIPFLLHSSAAMSSSIWERYDLKHHTTWEISADGDGVVKVLAPPGPVPSNGDAGQEVVGAEMLERLVNLYFETIAPFFPVVTKNEFLSLENPSALLLYSICAVAAARREIPRGIFSSLRATINGLIRQNDILSDTSIVNVQSLLIISNVGDLHVSVGAGGAVGAASVRLGVAIRMAQDLGLHRDEIKSMGEMSEHDRLEERAFLELKRRVWAGCVIMDRWYATSLGTPMLIDLLDCDVLLPDPCEVPLPSRVNDPSCQGQPYLFLSEFLKLSILLGRVTKTIYGPTGLLHANDQQLDALLTDLRAWKTNLPPPLRFVGPASTIWGGMLHILFGAIAFLFFRSFLRISYQCPSHLQFSMDVHQWSEVVSLSQEAIHWLSLGNNDQVLDGSFITSYSLTSLALVQYHTWARRKDMTALHSLQSLRDIVKRWEASMDTTSSEIHPMAIRRKTLEVMGLLYSAARHTSPHPTSNGSERTLNPTTGVVNRGEWAGQRVTFFKDPTLPGGGIFLAEDVVRKKLEDEGLSRDVVLGMTPTPTPDSNGSSGDSTSSAAVPLPPTPATAVINSDRVAPTPQSMPPPPAQAQAPTAHVGLNHESFNVNPHIQDIGLSNMGAAQVDDSVNDPTFGGLFHQDVFPPSMPSAAVNAGAAPGTDATASMNPEEMLEGLPTSVFDWGAWDSYFGRWSGLDSSPESDQLLGQGSGASRPGVGSGGGGGDDDAGTGMPPFSSGY